MKIYLINPRQKYVNYYAQTELGRLLGKKKFMVPLSLPVVAALTPPGHELRIIDEDIEQIDFSDVPDIVGITTLSSTITRAYEIADRYRQAGAFVVLGGAYASFVTHEVLEHADAVVSGEAEEAWPQLIRDFEAGTLKKLYKSEVACDFKKQAPPRWDLLPTDDIFQLGVQVSRGCPYTCEFCVATKMFGHKMRYRDVEDVMNEINALPVKRIFFIDDNFTMNKKYVLNLLPELKKAGLSWACMSSIEIAEDEELLQSMAEAGCFSILIGFESLNPESLEETGKRHNKSGHFYADAVTRIHNAGIHIIASFAVGFDNDTAAEFDRIAEFTAKNGLSYINLNLLGAPPGSELAQRLKSQGRWLDAPPDFRSGLFPSIRYMHFSSEEIFSKYLETITRIYSFKELAAKARILFGRGTFTRPYDGVAYGKSFRFKAFMKVAAFYLFSFSIYRLKLYFIIVHMIVSGKLAVDKGFSYLISMLSYHNHIRKIIRNKKEYLEKIRKYGSAPWKDFMSEVPAEMEELQMINDQK